MDPLPPGFAEKVICGECESAPPTWDCKDCSEYYCDACKALVHNKGQRKKHTNFEAVYSCANCSEHLASRKCEDCKGKIYCESCFMQTHNRTDGKYRRHRNFDVFGVKQPPFIDPDFNNGFGIDVRTLVATRFPHWVDTVAVMVQEAGAATIEPATADGEDQHYTDVDRLLLEGSDVLKKAFGWRRLNKILLDDMFAPKVAAARSVASASSARLSRTSITSGMSILSLDAILHSKWHKERLPHYLFERGNNTLLVGKHSGRRKTYGVVALTKPVEYEGFEDDDKYGSPERSYSANSDDDEPATPASPPASPAGGVMTDPLQSDPTSPNPTTTTTADVLFQNLPPTAVEVPPGKAYELAALTVALNRLALKNLFVSAAHYRSKGVLFLQLFDTASAQWRLHGVDDLFPCDAGNGMLFGLTEHSAETWKMFLLKGCAKLEGSMLKVERSADIIRALRVLTGGQVTVEAWQPIALSTRQESAVASLPTSDGAVDGATAPDTPRVDPRSERRRLIELLWWYVQKAAEHNCLIIAATTAVAEGTTAALNRPSTAPVLYPVTLPEAISRAFVSDEEKRANLRRYEQRTGSPPRKWYEHSETTVPDPPVPCAFRFDLLNCALPLYGVELSSKKATQMGMPREAFTGDNELALRLIKLRQFANWQQEALNYPSYSTTAPTTPPPRVGASVASSSYFHSARFKYYNSSPLWSKPLKEYFDVTTADDDLAYGTCEDLRSAFNSLIICSDVVGGTKMLPVTLQPVALCTGAVEAGKVRILLELASPDTLKTTSNAPLLRCEAYDCLAGSAVDDACEMLDVVLLSPPLNTEARELRRLDRGCGNASESELVLRPVPANGAQWMWRCFGEGGVAPHAPALSPARVQRPPSAASTTAEEEEEQRPVPEYKIPKYPESYVLVVSSKYPRGCLKALLVFNPEVVLRATLLHEPEADQ